VQGVAADIIRSIRLFLAGFFLCLATLVLRCYLGGSGKGGVSTGKSQHSEDVLPVDSLSSSLGNRGGTVQLDASGQVIRAQPLKTPAPIQEDPYAHTKPADRHAKVETRGGLLMPTFDIPAAQVKTHTARDPVEPPEIKLVTVPGAASLPAAGTMLESTWSRVEKLLSSSSSSSDPQKHEPSAKDWKDIAENFTFLAESAALHGAQVI